jgi:hypothetical protein
MMLKEKNKVRQNSNLKKFHFLFFLVELNKFRRELLSNRNWSPAFDSRMVDLLVDYFQRVRLANLTSLEQMYLLALADTLANASNESLSNQTYSGEKPSSKKRRRFSRIIIVCFLI